MNRKQRTPRPVRKAMMHDSTRVIGQPRQARPPTARTMAAIIATALLLLLAGACSGDSSSSAGSGGSPNAGGSASSPSAVAYSACMRTHGVPNYPDPDSNGNLPKGNAQAFGVSTSQYQAAERACRHLLPNSDSASLTQCLMTGDCPHAVVQQALEEGRTFAQCMRNHGVPNWPDSTIDSTGRPSFQVTAAGISIDSTRSPRMLSKIGNCQNQPGAVLLRQE
jgi:hypothetical protein